MRNVKKKTHEGFPGCKVYFTEADPAAQIAYSVGPGELTLKLKLWLLLTDHVILSAGHMLRSDVTFGWLHSHAEDIAALAADEAIVPSLSDAYRSLRDFAVDQGSIGPDSARTSDTKPGILDRAGLLDGLFPTAVGWAPAEEGRQFASMMCQHLRDPLSPLRNRMRGVPKDSIRRLADAVENSAGFNRGKLLELARATCPRRQNLVCRYGDCFYYLSGALHKNAFPLFHAREAELCRDAVAYASTAGSEPVSAPFWEDVLGRWGLTTDILERLSLREIREIRRSSVGVRVRQTWGKVVASAHERGRDKGTRTSAEAMERLVSAAFKEEIDAQRRRFAQWSGVRKSVEIGAWVSGGIGTLLGLATMNPVLAGVSFATGVLGMLSGPPIVDGVERRRPGSELVILANQIRSR
jgi:hypothetical protein